MNNIKPILFSTPMVQAILAGRKTQTRRICNHQFWSHSELVDFRINEAHYRKGLPDVSAKYQIGDILWARETWSPGPFENGIKTPFIYRADGDPNKKTIGKTTFKTKWKPSIFMPKEAARIFLKITDVRLERLKDISEEDAIAEGIELGDKNKGIMYKNYLKNQHFYLNPIWSFETLWQSIHGPGSWDANPWVFVYQFERCQKPKNFSTN